MKDLKQLRRIREKSWLGGVCAGIAYWLGWPLWFVRLTTFLVMGVNGVGLLLYILLWIFVPGADEVPEDYKERTGSLN